MKKNNIYRINCSQKQNMFIADIEDFSYFIEIDRYNHYLGSKILFSKLNRFHKLQKTINYPVSHSFETILDFLNYIKIEQRIVTISLCSKEETGYVCDTNDDLILIQNVNVVDGTFDGYTVLKKDFIDRFDWDSDQEKRLEKMTNKKDIDIDLTISFNIINHGQEMCEIYVLNKEGFMLGIPHIIDKDCFIINSINLNGDKEGFVLIKRSCIDYFRFRTTYISTYEKIEHEHIFKDNQEFLDYIKENKFPLYIKTRKRKYYFDCILTDYNDVFITILKNRKKHKIKRRNILMIDTTNTIE